MDTVVFHGQKVVPELTLCTHPTLQHVGMCVWQGGGRLLAVAITTKKETEL